MGMCGLLYRKICCRRGFGVHSPFVFDLITKVIEERYAYYFYENIGSAYLQLSQNKTLGCVLRTQGISLREGEFLFRMANYYQPGSILIVGSSLGLVPLCLAGYAATLRCIALEEQRDAVEMAMTHLREKMNPSVKISVGKYDEQLAPALETLKHIDFLYIGKAIDTLTQEKVFAQCLPYFQEQSICVMAYIRSSAVRRRQWAHFCLHPRVTVSMDLYQSGILFFYPQLHKRTYKAFID